MNTILVVDDEVQMLNLIGQLLEREGYRVMLATSAHQALAIAEHTPPDLFIIDAIMPMMDGLALCRQLRTMPLIRDLPIIFISGQESPYGVAEALEAGGDDYIRKPFAVRELTARLRAHLRRASHHSSEENLPTIRIYDDVRMVMVDDREVDLTQVEFELLRYLCLEPDKLHSTQDLLMSVWNYPPDAGDAALVRNHIRNLRRKLETAPERPEIIQSRHGRGYTVKAHVQIASNTMQVYA